MNTKFILLLVVSLFSTVLKAQDNVIDEVIAVVGDKAVLKSDIENQYYQYRSQYVNEAQPKCLILENLLFQKILLHQAEIDSIEVPETEVEANLARRIDYFIKQVGSQEKLEEYFGKTILEIKSDFKSDMRDQMIIEKMRNEITKNVRVTPEEIKDYFTHLPADSLTLYPKQYVLEHIVKQPVISDEERWRIRKKLNEFRDRIKNGEKFSTLAVLYSEDPGTAAKGGELGYMGRADLVPEFAKAAFSMKTPGEMSNIIETDFGFHLIQLIDRRGDRVNVRHILLVPKVKTKDLMDAKAKLDSIRQAIISFKDSLTFEKAAEMNSDDKETKNNGGLMLNPKTGKSNFELQDMDKTIQDLVTKMKPGEISVPFLSINRAGKKEMQIIRLVKVIPMHKMNLKDDYQDIQNRALAEKKQKKINEWIQEKIKETYIHIDDSYKRCDFQYNWLKN